MAIFATLGGVVQAAALRLMAEAAAEHARGVLLLTADQHIAVPGLSEMQRTRLQKRLDGDQRATPPSATTIITTAPVAGIGEGRSWLRQSVFADVLHALRDAPALGLFLGDATQPYLPLAPARLVALARAQEDQWNLGITRESGVIDILPGTLRGALLPEALRRIAPLLQPHHTTPETESALLVDRLDDLLRSAAPAPVPVLQRFTTPPGVLCLSQPAKGWDAGFVQDLCLFAQTNGVSTLGVSPTRSLMLHGLNGSARAAFKDRCLLQRFAENPNPWQRHLFAEPGQEFAADLLAHLLFEACPVNPGFALALQGATSPAAGVHFSLSPVPQRGLWLRAQRQKYSVVLREEGDFLYAPPQPGAEALGLPEAAKFILAQIEQRLCRVSSIPAKAPGDVALPATVMCQCGECQTAYDEALGDPVGGVPAGTPFGALPAGWSCPVCGAATTAFAARKGVAA